jgi:hypothetical protein
MAEWNCRCSNMHRTNYKTEGIEDLFLPAGFLTVNFQRKFYLICLHPKAPMPVPVQISLIHLNDKPSHVSKIPCFPRTA